MAEISLDTLRKWWRELARRELELEDQYKPLVDEHAAIHSKRMALENLMAQGQPPTFHQEIGAEWEGLRREKQLPSTGRRPPDTAYDVLSRKGVPMHYKEILTEMNKQGVVIGGHNPGTTLIAYLGRDKRFAKAREVGRGYWRLQERGKDGTI
jgi:hypothetical protein